MNINCNNAKWYNELYEAIWSTVEKENYKSYIVNWFGSYVNFVKSTLSTCTEAINDEKLTLKCNSLKNAIRLLKNDSVSLVMIYSKEP